MKRFNYYLSLMLLLVFTAACSDEFDQPPMVVPVAEHTANMTIAEFKAKHWQDDRNFIDTVTDNEIIHGWITSSDEDGNVYKQIYISDGTAGLTVSIDQASLYTKYRIGQEVVIPMQGRYIGKFNGTYCLGIPYWYEAQSVWESNRMPMETWEAMAELNGFPDLSKVDTTLIDLSEIKDVSDPQVLLKYMSRLVRINGVSFEEGGEVYAETNDNNKNTIRVISDDDGNTLNVSNSQYASFRAQKLPMGIVDVVGQLSYTASDGFFLILRSASDVIEKTAGGTKRSPFTVEQAIAGVNTGMRGWFGGYAVGAVAPEVTTVSSNADIEWKAPTTLDNTIVLADDPECKDYTKCVIVNLPQGSSFREQANLRNNANVYKTFVKVRGEAVNYMGGTGITCAGSYETYILDVALTEMQEGFESGSIPSTWTNKAVSGGAKWSTYSYNSGGKTITCAQFRLTSTSSQPIESWLITPKLNLKDARSKIFNFTSEVNNTGNNYIELYLLNSNDPTTATVKVKLNPILPAQPTGTNYSAWTSSGDIDLLQWSDGNYYIGFCYTAPAGSTNTTWCIDDVTFGMGEPAPADNRADFESMGDASGQVGNFTSTKGWVATNCYLFEGGPAGCTNPQFEFIGYMTDSHSTYAKAPTLNGKTGNEGKIVSPVIHGGMKKLTFKYGAPYSDKLLSFRVDVKQNGNVVESWTESKSEVVRQTAYTFERTCNVSGDFTIEITNLCPSNSATTNKDRAAIWNMVWDPAN